MHFQRTTALLNCGLILTFSFRCIFRPTALSTHSAVMGRKGLSSKRADPYSEAEYSCVDGIRSVIPYVHEFTTHAKGRWIGREIIEVLTREFGGHPKEYWDNAISRGHVRINDKIVLDQYRFKNNDAMLHRTHRHEPSIAGIIEFVGHSESLMAVSKPPSIPVHPCGAYRFNSLMYILAKEPMIENQPVLYLVHRLDRVTSGLVVLAKSKEAAARLSKEIRDKSTKKTYLARVKGMFPKNILKFRMTSLDDVLNVPTEDDDDEDDSNGDNNGNSSNSNKQKNKQSNNQKDNEKDKQKQSEKDKQKSKKRNHEGALKESDISESDLPPRVREIPSLEEVVGSGRVGCHVDVLTGDVTLRCPIGVISHRDGVHACDPLEGKEAMTSFSMLGYDALTDTSLVECRPITGRTHQLRLHLQILGNSIANDPCYGGELFYGDQSRRTRALEVLRAMRKEGKHPLSKVPHLGDPELDRPPEIVRHSHGGSSVETQNDTAPLLAPHAVTAAASSTAVENDSDTSPSPTTTTTTPEAAGEVAAVEPTEAVAPSVAEGDVISPVIIEAQRDGETDQEYLVRTCRYCKEQKESQELERLLHCDGIWLHALRYQGKGWMFQAPTPVWAVGDSFAAVSVSVSVASPDIPSQSSAPVSVAAVVTETPSVGTEQVAEGGGAISE